MKIKKKIIKGNDVQTGKKNLDTFFLQMQIGWDMPNPIKQKKKKKNKVNRIVDRK